MIRAKHSQEIHQFLEKQKCKKHQTAAQRGEYALQLARLILSEAEEVHRYDERLRDAELARMFEDASGKAFSTTMHDQCFRTENDSRIAQQMNFLLGKYGTPKFLNFWTQLQIKTFRLVPQNLQKYLVPLIKKMLRRKTHKVIFPGENQRLYPHIEKRKSQGVRSNINRLGEAILGEAEAESRLQLYLRDLAAKKIDYMSIKISTIFSQINTRAWGESLDILSERLRRLYRAAMKNASGGSACFINLDMEEYRDLRLTCELFKRVLNEDEFLKLKAGIVLQAYLPDSYELLEDLIAFTRTRCERGGVPLKLRIVKGANLAMEQLEASHSHHTSAPFTDKLSVDAHYKKMLELALRAENARALNIGIASHNLFELSYACLLIAENDVKDFCEFEMLEGMAPHLHRVINRISGKTVLYCPVARECEFNNAIAYLIRRLDEQSSEENFLRHSFKLASDKKCFADQANFFMDGIKKLDGLSSVLRRNYLRIPQKRDKAKAFVNEANTDFVLEHNLLSA